jgi:hypothetical protein
VVNKSVWADIGAASTSSTSILVLLVLAAPIYWCCNVCNTNILVLLVLAAPIGEDTQTFYNFKNFAAYLNVCSVNILVLTGLQHQYIGAVQGESKCLQHHAYSVKRCLLGQLEYAEVEIELFQDGGQIKSKKKINHHNGS